MIKSPSHPVWLRSWTFCVLGAAALITSACGTTSSSTQQKVSSAPTTTQQLKPVTIAFAPAPLPDFPEYVAYKEGFYKQNGLNAQLVPVSNAAAGIAAMEGGSAEIGSLPDPFVFYQSTGKIWPFISGLSNNFWEVVSTGSPIQGNSSSEIASLKGEKIGLVGIGSAVYYALLDALSQGGLNKSQVTVVNIGGIGPPEIAALKNGTVNALLVDDGTGATALKDIPNAHVLISLAVPGLLPPGIGGSGINARSSWVSSHPTEVSDFQKAMAETQLWMQNPKNFTTVQTLMSQRVSVTGTALTALTHLAVSSLVNVSESVTDLSTLYNFDLKNGLLKKPISVEVNKWLAPGVPQSAAQIKSIGS